MQNEDVKDYLLSEYKQKMLAITLNEDEDTEGRHLLADDLLCELLDKLGFQEVTDLFNGMNKWYA